MSKLKLLILSAVVALLVRPISADVLMDTSFEDSPGSEWITFNNAFQDNGEQANTGVESLKIFGLFTGGDNFNGAFQDVAVDGTDFSVGDSIQLEAFGFTPSGDSFPDGSPITAFVEITWFDPGGLEEFGFGTNVSGLIDWNTTEDSWEFLQTPVAIIPVEAQFIRVKAILHQPAGNFDGGAAFFDDFSLNKVAAIPEPGTFGLLACGALGLLGMVGRRRRS